MKKQLENVTTTQILQSEKSQIKMILLTYRTTLAKKETLIRKHQRLLSTSRASVAVDMAQSIDWMNNNLTQEIELLQNKVEALNYNLKQANMKMMQTEIFLPIKSLKRRLVGKLMQGIVYV